MSGLRAYFVLFLKGMAMGAADVVPGVSGGTIAFISGIYEELLRSIRACTPLALVSLFRDGPKVFWRRINGTFCAINYLSSRSPAFIIVVILLWLNSGVYFVYLATVGAKGLLGVSIFAPGSVCSPGFSICSACSA